MTAVLDASAVFGLLSGPPYLSAIEAAEHLVAPEFVVVETLNARWRLARAGRAAPSVSTILAFCDRVRLERAQKYARRAAELADRLDHSVYDCLYLAVAEQERGILLTLDGRLSARVRGTRLARLVSVLDRPR